MKRIGFVALALVGAITAAFAQTYPPAQVQNVNPTSDLIQVIPRGAPSAQSVYAPPAEISNASQYAKVTITTSSTNYTTPGYTNSFGNYQEYLILTPPGTLAYTYVNFAASPNDGARECVFSTQTVTASYFNGATGQTVNNAPTALVANTGYCFLYSLSNLTWDRN